MKKINFIFLFNIIFGLILFIYIFWVRFLRERLPKNLPFNLTLFFMVIIIFISLIYLYQLKQIIKPIVIPSLKKQGSNIFAVYWATILQNCKPLYAILQNYKPLSILQETIIQNKYLHPFIYSIVVKLVNIFITLHIYKRNRYAIFNIIFFLLPRAILAIFFGLDIFYFHKIDLFYKLLPLGLIPMLASFFTNCVKAMLEKNICQLEKKFVVELNTEDQKPNTNYFIDIDLLSNHKAYDHDPSNPKQKILHVKLFIDLQATNIWCGDHLYKYKCIETMDAREEYALKNNIKLSFIFFTRSNYDDISKELAKEFYHLMPIAINLRVYYICQENKLLNITFRRVQVIIYLLLLVCWSYILFTANYEYVFTDLIILLEKFQDNNNPFSGYYQEV